MMQVLIVVSGLVLFLFLVVFLF